jgi:hypothetical protein
MNQLSLLCQKMHNERVKSVKENEEFVNKGGDSSDEDGSWSDDEDENDMNQENNESPNKNDDSDDEDYEFKQ